MEGALCAAPQDTVPAWGKGCSLWVPGLGLLPAPTLSHSPKETNQPPFFPRTAPAHSCQVISAVRAARVGIQLPAGAGQSHPGQSRAQLGHTRGSVSLWARSCVTRHAGPAPSLSPCAAVVPTRSPGFRHCCVWAARVPNHPGLRGTLLERAFGAAFPKALVLHGSRDRAHALPSPPCSGCTSGRQMLAQTLAGAGDKGSHYLLWQSRASTAGSSQIYLLPGWDDPAGPPGDCQPTCLAQFPAQHPKHWQQPHGLSMAEPIQRPLHPRQLLLIQHMRPGWKTTQSPLTFGSSF